MSVTSISQEEQEIKCGVEWCAEDAWRDGLCWFHFCEEKVAEWDAQDAERETCLAGVGYR